MNTRALVLYLSSGGACDRKEHGKIVKVYNKKSQPLSFIEVLQKNMQRNDGAVGSMSTFCVVHAIFWKKPNAKKFVDYSSGEIA